MRARVTHELKSWLEFFQPTLNGHKRFELRRDDRPEGFQVEDELLLREWDPEAYNRLLSLEHETPPDEVLERFVQAAYTGREVLVRVDYVMSDEQVISVANSMRHNDVGFVIMSISRVE